MSNKKELELRYRRYIDNILNDNQDKEYLRGYINFINDIAIRSQYRYLNAILNFVNKANKDINELSFDDFNNYIGSIKYKENGEENTSSYQIVIYSAIKRFNEYLYISKKISENYMLCIKRPKKIETQETIKRREMGFLTKDEIKIVMNALDFYNGERRSIQDCWRARDKAIIYLFLNTGIRLSALISIEVNDLELNNKTLYVTDKGSKVRKFNLSDDLCNILDSWVKYRNELLKGYEDTNALFININRKILGIKGVTTVVKKYCQFIDDKNITPHKLRATYGTQLYNETGDIYFVQDCMGHSSPTVTELYIREKKQNTKRASDIMSKILK